MKLKVKLEENAIQPTRAHANDAGLDLYAPVDTWVYHDSIACVDTGVHVAIPEGYVGLITSKSGLMAQGVTCRGTIDSGYTGSITAVLCNAGEGRCFHRGDKITQLVIVPCITPDVEIVDELDETDRGSRGFGSSGK